MDGHARLATIETLVFGGGGARGFSYLGALMALQDRFGFDVQRCSAFAGTSVGALMALLLALNMSTTEIVALVQGIDLGAIFAQDPMFILTHHSLNDGSALTELIVGILRAKGFTEGTTLKELFAATGKRLVITVTDLCCAGVLYLDHISEPDMPVKKAVMASMALPPLFAPVAYKDMLLVDGGLLDNFPIQFFDVTKTLGFRVQWYIDPKPPYDLNSYFTRVIACMHLTGVKLCARVAEAAPFVIHMDVGCVQPTTATVDVQAMVFKGYRDAIRAVETWPTQLPNQNPVEYFPESLKRRHELPRFLTLACGDAPLA